MTHHYDLIEHPKVVPSEVVAFARTLVANRGLAGSLEVTRADVSRSSLEKALDAAFSPLASTPGVGACVAWLADTGEEFGTRFGFSALNMRMVHSRRPMCPRFHIDNVQVRLIATLTGPGSEWIRTEDVAYHADQICQTPEPEKIQHMSEGQIGYFRGSGYAGGDDDIKGVVHRSPMQEQDRVVVTMDVVS